MQVRSELFAHNGYEVEVEDANFVCSFSNAYEAVMFNMACQKTLMKVNWSSLLLS